MGLSDVGVGVTGALDDVGSDVGACDGHTPDTKVGGVIPAHTCARTASQALVNVVPAAHTGM